MTVEAASVKTKAAHTAPVVYEIIKFRELDAEPIFSRACLFAATVELTVLDDEIDRCGVGLSGLEFGLCAGQQR